MRGWHSDMFTTQFVFVEDATPGLAVFQRGRQGSGTLLSTMLRMQEEVKGGLWLLSLDLVTVVLFVLEIEPYKSQGSLNSIGCVHQQPQPGLGVVGLRCNLAFSCNKWNCQPVHACKISNLWHLLRGGKGTAAGSLLGGVRKGRMECRKDDLYLSKRIRNRSSMRQHVHSG